MHDPGGNKVPIRPIRPRGTALGPHRLGRSAAIAQGPATWFSTSGFRTERLEVIAQTEEHLREVSQHCANKRHCLAIERLLDETAAFLHDEMPAHLPFLVSSRSTPRRLRIATIMREWLLTSTHPRRRDHLRKFLLAYQEISPLCLVEVRLLGAGLHLAMLDKCRLLPSTEKLTHIELLPRLVRQLAQTYRFIARTDWKKLGEEVSQVHFLLNRDPTQAYPHVDFSTRDACRKSVERLSRLTCADETKTAGEAVALAEQEKAPVANFLLGPGRVFLVRKLAKTPNQPRRASWSAPPLPPFKPPAADVRS